MSFCLVWNHTRNRIWSSSHTYRNASVAAIATVAFYFAHQHQHIIALHCTHLPWRILALLFTLSNSVCVSVYLPLLFITQCDGVDANERAFQTQTHTQNKLILFFVNAIWFFLSSLLIFPMLVRHSYIYSPYFICAAILCLYATDTIKVFDYV